MRRNSIESDSKVAVKELEKEFLDRLATQEEFHRAMSKNWEEEKAGLMEKVVIKFWGIDDDGNIDDDDESDSDGNVGDSCE